MIYSPIVVLEELTKLKFSLSLIFRLFIFKTKKKGFEDHQWLPHYFTLSHCNTKMEIR